MLRRGPEGALGRLRPDIWVRGGDYDGRELPEEAVLGQWAGMAVTVPYLDGRLTTRIAAAAAAASAAAGRPVPGNGYRNGPYP